MKEPDGSYSREIKFEPFEGDKIEAGEIIGAAIAATAADACMESPLSEVLQRELKQDVMIKAYFLLLHCLSDTPERGAISTDRLDEAIENGEVPPDLMPLVLMGRMTDNFDDDINPGFSIGWETQKKDNGEKGKKDVKKDNKDNKDNKDTQNPFRKDTI